MGRVVTKCEKTLILLMLKLAKVLKLFVFNWGDAPSLSRRAPNEGAKSIPKDHVIDLCDINASLLPRPGIEPGPAA